MNATSNIEEYNTLYKAGLISLKSTLVKY